MATPFTKKTTMAHFIPSLRFRLVPKNRRGAIVVLAAVLLVILLGMIAFAVDFGYVVLVRTQLQTAADSAALAAATTGTTITEAKAVAQDYANRHIAGGRNVSLQSSDIVPGTWNADTRTFTEIASGLGNAIKVTTKMDDTTGGQTQLFFGNLFGISSLSQEASAIATTNPRDICFVIDLSASMHYDAEPDYDTGSSVRAALIQKAFDDLGFGATYSYTKRYPPSSSANTYWAGYPALTTSKSSSWKSSLITALAASTYRGTIYYTGTRGMSSAAKDKAAYSYVIDYTIKQYAMPNATPTPNSQTSTYYTYWSNYIDWYDSTKRTYNYNYLGYTSYLEYMTQLGRDGKTSDGHYTPYSVNSDVVSCKKHSEVTAGGTFNFSASEQPTHGGRRAIIAALQLIKERNETITDSNHRDWVSIIGYDSGTDPASGVEIYYSLNSDYDAAMAACTQLQACHTGGACTATATGLLAAYNHIKPAKDGGLGRTSTNKMVILLTDGAPNLLPTNYSLTVTSYTGNSYKDAALSVAAFLQAKKWYVYAVGIGLSCDSDFMSRMATLGGTSSTHIASDVENYESDLTSIFDNIITHPKAHLVQ